MSYAFGSPERQLHSDLPGSGNWRNMELHIGFKFSRADMLSGLDPYRQGLYLAYVSRTFEKAYEWVDRHPSLTAWNENLYQKLNLPEVNVVLSGNAQHPILPSKFDEVIGPWIDQLPDKPTRVPGTLDILKHMTQSKAEIVIQGDALHAPKHIIAINGEAALDTALKEASKELMQRAVRLERLQSLELAHPQVPSDALAYWNGAVLNAHDTRGMQVSMSRITQAYVEIYQRLQNEPGNLTPDQLKYGTAVELAGRYAQESVFNNEKQMFHEIMEDAISGLEDANKYAKYNNLTPEYVMNDILKQLPDGVKESFAALWNNIQPEVQAEYPDKSPQWQTLTTATRVLQCVQEMLPQQLSYELFHNLDIDSRFVDSMEGQEYEAITPFD